MKKSLTLSLIALLVCIALPAFGDELSFKVPMTAAQIPPPLVDAPGTGTFRIEFAEDFSSAKYDLNLSNIENLVQHIHCAAAGELGPVVVTLNQPGGVITNASIAPPDPAGPCGVTINTVAALYNALRLGQLYVNVHTLDNLPGEIRGQIFPGAQEVDDD